MNKIKITVIGLALAVSVFFNINTLAQSPTAPPTDGGGQSSAQQPMDLPMIQSEDALRNYALSIAKYGGRGVYSPTLDWNWVGNHHYTNTTGNYGEEILDKLFNAELKYRLTNPNDEVRGYTYLYDGPFGDSMPNMLFYGEVRYTVADLRTNKPMYGVWMLDIPLPLHGISSAGILKLDASGKTVGEPEPLQIKNGQPIFPSYRAGATNGILVVKSDNGSTVAYYLAAPVGIVPTATAEMASYKVDGHYIYRTEGKPVMVRIIETWKRPSMFLKTIGETVVSFDVTGIVQDGVVSFERPLSMEVSNGSVSWTIPMDDGFVPTDVKFPAGEFRIRFNWIKFGKPNMIYTGPTDGGKG